MGRHRAVIDIIHVNIILMGFTRIPDMGMGRFVHSIRQRIDTGRAFRKWFSCYLKSRMTGRKLVFITLIEHLGDIVACEPIARYIRNQEPDAFIVWCVKKDYSEIIRQFPEVDGIVHAYCLTTWIALRRWAIIDRIIDLHINGRTCSMCKVPLVKKEGDLHITLDNYYHYGSLLASFSRSAGLPALNDQPRLQLPGKIADEIAVFGLDNGYIVVHCSSNESCRDWSPVKWNKMLDNLQTQTSVTVVEIGFESQLRRCESKRYRNLCGKLSILQIAEVIRRAKVFVGIDSGPAHMANAVGTPGVVLLGQYRAFKKYNPFTGAYHKGELAELIYSDGPVSMIEVESVQKAIERRLAL
jgi:heptosyltransferase-3